MQNLGAVYVLFPDSVVPLSPVLLTNLTEEIKERFLLVRPDSRLELNIMCSTLHYCLKFANILSDDTYIILYL